MKWLLAVSLMGMASVAVAQPYVGPNPQAHDYFGGAPAQPVAYAPPPSPVSAPVGSPIPAHPAPAYPASPYPASPTMGQMMPAPSSWYWNLHAELSYVNDTDLKIGGAKVGDLEMDVEYAVGAAIGYAAPAEWGFFADTRYEIELMYREVDFKNLSGSVIAPGGFGGSEESYVAMLNAYYDYETGTRLTPYLGFGLGIAHQTFDSITINTDDSDTVLAYQGMLDVAYAIRPQSQSKIGLGYRYFGTADPEFTTAGGTSVEHAYDGHNLEAFVRVPF